MQNLSRKLGEVSYDNLFAGAIPQSRPMGGVIRKEATAAVTYKRGTLLAKSSVDAKLVILGTTAATSETLEPYGVLCDDVTVGTAEDEPCVIYAEGNFNSNSLIVASGYTITEQDKDTLRKYGIVMSAAMP